jgi:CSLREA domain-containing protein
MLRNPQSKLLMWGGRTTGLVVGFAVIGALLMALVLALPALAVPSTFIVISTGNANDLDFPSGTFDGTSDGVCDVNASISGQQCTLRAAIQEANVNNNPTDQDRINFNITGPGFVRTITPNSALPTIEEPVIIDGYSQAGTSQNTQAQGTNAILRIQLNGTNTTDDDGLEIEASNTVVKGLVINRFSRQGIRTERSGDADLLTNVRIEGNFIGTNRAGTSALGNDEGGVVLFPGSTNTTVGGTSLASRNLISGNEISGVSIGLGADRNKVQGNLIGTQRDGISALGNEFDGVAVFQDFGDPGVGNSILSNSIFANGVGSGDAGIDLGANGPTPNDEGDTDTGANRLQNFPELSSATTISGTTTIEGTLDTRPKEPYTIQFFSSPSAGVGETVQGQRFIGSKTVFTNADGDATFSFTPTTAVTVGRQITATATRQATGDTSEFSAAQEVTAP